MAQDNLASVLPVEHGAPPTRTRSDPSGQQPALAASLTTLLVTDLVGSTALVERLGDARAARLFTRLDAAARALLAAHHGREIDKTDGFLLLFERPVEAVAFALAYHAELARLGTAERVVLAARVGIHVGEVFVRANPAADVQRGAKPLEVDGLAKVVAARLMALAEGGQTLLSRAAFDLTRPAAAEIGVEGVRLAWLAHGTYRFKGIEGPAEVFEVGVPGVAPLRPPKGSAKVEPAGSGAEVLGWRPAVGQLVPGRPQWHLERRLGVGGFGEAWLARHSDSGDPRVVKFCFGQEQVRALQREVTLCRVLREVGELDEALQLYLEALAVQERALGPQHADLGSFFNNIAHIHQDRGDFEKALEYFRRALEVRRAALGEENPDTALSINNLAYCLWLAGESDAAAALFDRALALREQLLGSDHPEVAFTRANLALVAVARGEWEGASNLFQRAITSASVAFGGDRPSMIPMLEGYEALLRYRGEGAEADEIAARIRALREGAARRGERLPPPVVIRFPATAAGTFNAGAR